MKRTICFDESDINKHVADIRTDIENIYVLLEHIEDLDDPAMGNYARKIKEKLINIKRKVISLI